MTTQPDVSYTRQHSDTDRTLVGQNGTLYRLRVLPEDMVARLGCSGATHLLFTERFSIIGTFKESTGREVRIPVNGWRALFGVLGMFKAYPVGADTDWAEVKGYRLVDQRDPRP